MLKHFIRSNAVTLRRTYPNLFGPNVSHNIIAFSIIFIIIFLYPQFKVLVDQIDQHATMAHIIYFLFSFYIKNQSTFACKSIPKRFCHQLGSG